MTGAWHGGKGDKTCPEAKSGSYAENFPAIDWNAREREDRSSELNALVSGLLREGLEYDKRRASNG